MCDCHCVNQEPLQDLPDPQQSAPAGAAVWSVLYLDIHCYPDTLRAGKFSLDYYTVLVFISHSSSRLSPQLAGTVAATLAMLGTLLLLPLVR